MALQEGISRKRLARKLGSVQQALVDARGPEGAVGRSSANAPEIDGVVHIAPDPRLRVGEFFNVVVDETDAHDVRAHLPDGGAPGMSGAGRSPILFVRAITPGCAGNRDTRRASLGNTRRWSRNH